MSRAHSSSIASLPPLLVCCQHTLKIFQSKSTLTNMAWVLLHENLFDFIPEVQLSGSHLPPAAFLHLPHIDKRLIVWPYGASKDIGTEES